MKLGDLVSELRENILRDTSDTVNANPSNYLLSDKSLVRYINEAQQKFATRTLCLRDESTAEVCNITLVAGQAAYDLDKRVVAVYGAASSDNKLHLQRTTYASMTGAPDVPYGDAWNTRAQDGRPHLFYTDRETGRIGIYPAPDAEHDGRTLVLRVGRLPLYDLTPDNLDAEPEVPSQWHMDLLEYAAWRALRNHDSDLENLQKASAHKKAFEDVVLLLEREAKRLLMQNIQFRVGQYYRR